MRAFQRSLVVRVLFGLVVFALANRLEAGDAVRQEACELNRSVTVTMKYLLYLPKDYEQKPSWPLLLFLHGKGERGDNLELVKKHGPPKLIAAGKALPFIVVAPQCPSCQSWESFELTALLDEIIEKYKVDHDRIYVTGLSMGGFATWALAARTPGRFAAILPVCGGGDPSQAERIAGTPAWVFHGGKDEVVPLATSQKMIDALKKNSGKAKFTVYPNAGHDAWTETYANPRVYEWLLEQKRTPKKTGKAAK